MILTGNYPLFAIVGGSTKSGTTSVYHYLKSHPEVCVSSLKETRYFLDDDYPLPAKYHFSRDGIRRYLSYFHDPDRVKKVWVEVTPDYLYSSGTPGSIKRTLPEPKIIFLLREPVSRVMSWYRFALQNGFIDPEITPDEYVQRQLDGKASRQQCWLTVEQGRYSDYLAEWFVFFRPEDVKIIFFEELVTDPLGQMKSLAEFLGIFPDYYNSFDFQPYNQTVSVRFPKLHHTYRRVQRLVKGLIFPYPKVYAVLRDIRRSGLEPLYTKINRQSTAPEFQFSLVTLQALYEYYGPSNEKLVKMVNRSLPNAWAIPEGSGVSV